MKVPMYVQYVLLLYVLYRTDSIEKERFFE